MLLWSLLILLLKLLLSSFVSCMNRHKTMSHGCLRGIRLFIYMVLCPESDSIKHILEYLNDPLTMPGLDWTVLTTDSVIHQYHLNWIYEMCTVVNSYQFCMIEITFVYLLNVDRITLLHVWYFYNLNTCLW